MFLVAAAGITVHTRKPDLLENLSVRLSLRRLGPQCRHEVFAPLVECQRMKCMLDTRPEIGVVEAIVAAEVENIEALEIGWNPE